ncbi:uncharacterized protein si:ch211-227n13.3 isoform X2 [Thunnus thynnus]|uniref:uncharacterized protein si:ch211-227n13.3 isoform X2 n=1 Tax=Thunnus thynnus TaxID=8237 RepID=UPI0035273EA4
MSKVVNCERPDTKTAADNLCEADGFHSLSIKVEYYRSLEYRLKWKSHMYTRRSSRLLNSSKNKNAQESPSSDVDVIQRQLRSKRHRTWLREADNGVLNTDEDSGHDIIDLISNTHDEEHVTVEDDGKVVEVADKGVDESDEDCGSDNSSIASGPSLLYINSQKKPKPSQGLCSACRKLYQKAKTMKVPLKDKLLDNDPSSLTCDQWVLLKQWRPRRLPDARGNLLMHVQLVKKRLEKKGAKQSEQYLRGSSFCSRPQPFLQRNLRRRVKVPAKKVKKNRKKRARDDSQGSRIAKQKRLHSNNAGQYANVNGADYNSLHSVDGHSSSPGFEGCCNEESDNEADTCLIELKPSSVTLVPNKPVDVSPKKKAAKRTAGFRDLLAQLRGNSSMIIRETR